MEAKDGSSGFDFTGEYSTVDKPTLIEYTIIDGRKVKVSFVSKENQTAIKETFEAENIHSLEMQQAGWQAILDNFKKYVESNEGNSMQKIIPHLWFNKEARDATTFYASLFENSKVKNVTTITGTPSGDCDIVTFDLAGQEFMAMDSSMPHDFSFNEALSFVVYCDNQEEIDYYWEKLSAAPEAEQCGWLKDKYGVSWQIVPSVMHDMMTSCNKEKIARVTQAFLKMKKFDIAKLHEAYERK